MIFKLLLISLYSSLLFTSNAHAYIDPGTFSIVIQAIIGGIIAGGVTIKIYWYKIKSFFKKKDKDKLD
tara:strand:- start:564 stop:767 length:204 start_codon:yes stop_codon:yes gene_type:complete